MPRVAQALIPSSVGAHSYLIDVDMLSIIATSNLLNGNIENWPRSRCLPHILWCSGADLGGDTTSVPWCTRCSAGPRQNRGQRVSACSLSVRPAGEQQRCIPLHRRHAATPVRTQTIRHRLVSWGQTNWLTPLNPHFKFQYLTKLTPFLFFCVPLRTKVFFISPLSADQWKKEGWSVDGKEKGKQCARRTWEWRRFVWGGHSASCRQSVYVCALLRVFLLGWETLGNFSFFCLPCAAVITSSRTPFTPPSPPPHGSSSSPHAPQGRKSW